jgi:hypothetical protein
MLIVDVMMGQTRGGGRERGVLHEVVTECKPRLLCCAILPGITQLLDNDIGWILFSRGSFAC